MSLFRAKYETSVSKNQFSDLYNFFVTEERCYDREGSVTEGQQPEQEERGATKEDWRDQEKATKCKNLINYLM